MPRRSSTRRPGWGRRSNPAETFLASTRLNTAGMLAAADSATHAAALSSNMQLVFPDEVWRRLWHYHANLSVARDLVSRPLTADQLDTVIADESRISVLAYALEYTAPTDTQALAVLAKPCGGAVARETTPADSWALSPAVWDQWCAAAGGLIGVRWLTANPDVDAAPYLADEAWVGRPTRQMRGAVAALLVANPDAIEGMCAPEAPVELAAEAAASHLLGGRDELAYQLADRSPAYHHSDAELVSLWHVWLGLADNPFVAQEVIDHLRQRWERHGRDANWQRFVETYVQRRGVSRQAAAVFPGSLQRGSRYRAAIGYRPEAGVTAITGRHEQICLIETLARLQRSCDFDYRSLAALVNDVAETLLDGGTASTEKFGDIIAEQAYIEVLGVDRVREIVRASGSSRRVCSPRAKTRRESWQAPRRAVVDGFPLPVRDLHYVDEDGAARLGAALETTAQWQTLFSLLESADYGDDDVLALIEAARQLSPTGS